MDVGTGEALIRLPSGIEHAVAMEKDCTPDRPPIFRPDQAGIPTLRRGAIPSISGETVSGPSENSVPRGAPGRRRLTVFGGLKPPPGLALLASQVERSVRARDNYAHDSNTLRNEVDLDAQRLVGI